MLLAYSSHANNVSQDDGDSGGEADDNGGGDDNDVGLTMVVIVFMAEKGNGYKVFSN